MTSVASKGAARYHRISEDRDGLEAGVTRQDEDTAALAKRQGLRVVATFTDNDIGASTRSRKRRPQFEEMMRRAKAGEFGAILFYSTSRLTRRPKEFEQLIELAEKQHVRLISCTSGEVDLSTPNGRHIARILASTDARESEELGDRVKRAALQRAQLGKNHGGRRSFGYTADGSKLDRAEAAEVKKWYRKIMAGESLGSIVRDLEARGVRTVTGGPWTSNTVRGVLLRPRNAGLSVHKREIVGKGKWPAIVPVATYEAAVALLSDPDRRTSPGNRAAYLLSGVAKCGRCGGGLIAGMVRTKPGAPQRRIYRCRARGCGLGRRIDHLDGYVTEVVLRRLARPDAADLFAPVADSPDAEELRQEAQALRVRMDTLADSFADGAITRAQLERGTARATKRLDAIRAELGQVHTAPVITELAGAKDVRKVWPGLGLERQRAVVAALFDVYVLPAAPGRRAFDPDRVAMLPPGSPRPKV